ncbi:SLATT domain-containing protein [Clostridium perfringens]
MRQIFASVVWCHKIQEKQSDIYLFRNNVLDVSRIILSALTSSGIFAILFVDNFILKLITALISAVTLFINTYFKSYNLKLMHKQCKTTAIEFLELREDIVSTLCDIKIDKYTEEELREKRNKFIGRKMEIVKCSPEASNRAVKKAGDALKIKNDNTFTDEEIDSYLPVLARKNNVYCKEN